MDNVLFWIIYRFGVIFLQGKSIKAFRKLNTENEKIIKSNVQELQNTVVSNAKTRADQTCSNNEHQCRIDNKNTSHFTRI